MTITDENKLHPIFDPFRTEETSLNSKTKDCPLEKALAEVGSQFKLIEMTRDPVQKLWVLTQIVTHDPDKQHLRSLFPHFLQSLQRPFKNFAPLMIQDLEQNNGIADAALFSPFTAEDTLIFKINSLKSCIRQKIKEGDLLTVLDDIRELIHQPSASWHLVSPFLIQLWSNLNLEIKFQQDVHDLIKKFLSPEAQLSLQTLKNEHIEFWIESGYMDCALDKIRMIANDFDLHHKFLFQGEIIEKYIEKGNAQKAYASIKDLFSQFIQSPYKVFIGSFIKKLWDIRKINPQFQEQFLKDLKNQYEEKVVFFQCIKPLLLSEIYVEFYTLYYNKELHSSFTQNICQLLQMHSKTEFSNQFYCLVAQTLLENDSAESKRFFQDLFTILMKQLQKSGDYEQILLIMHSFCSSSGDNNIKGKKSSETGNAAKTRSVEKNLPKKMTPSHASLKETKNVWLNTCLYLLSNLTTEPERISELKRVILFVFEKVISSSDSNLTEEEASCYLQLLIEILKRSSDDLKEAALWIKKICKFKVANPVEDKDLQKIVSDCIAHSFQQKQVEAGVKLLEVSSIIALEQKTILELWNIPLNNIVTDCIAPAKQQQIEASVKLLEVSSTIALNQEPISELWNISLDNFRENVDPFEWLYFVNKHSSYLISNNAVQTLVQCKVKKDLELILKHLDAKCLNIKKEDNLKKMNCLISLMKTSKMYPIQLIRRLLELAIQSDQKLKVSILNLILDENYPIGLKKKADINLLMDVVFKATDSRINWLFNIDETILLSTLKNRSLQQLVILLNHCQHLSNKKDSIILLKKITEILDIKDFDGLSGNDLKCAKEIFCSLSQLSIDLQDFTLILSVFKSAIKFIQELDTDTFELFSIEFIKLQNLLKTQSEDIRNPFYGLLCIYARTDKIQHWVRPGKIALSLLSDQTIRSTDKILCIARLLRIFARSIKNNSNLLLSDITSPTFLENSQSTIIKSPPQPNKKLISPAIIPRNISNKDTLKSDSQKIINAEERSHLLKLLSGLDILIQTPDSRVEDNLKLIFKSPLFTALFEENEIHAREMLFASNVLDRFSQLTVVGDEKLKGALKLSDVLTNYFAHLIRYLTKSNNCFESILTVAFQKKLTLFLNKIIGIRQSITDKALIAFFNHSSFNTLFKEKSIYNLVNVFFSNRLNQLEDLLKKCMEADETLSDWVMLSTNGSISRLWNESKCPSYDLIKKALFLRAHFINQTGIENFNAFVSEIIKNIQLKIELESVYQNTQPNVQSEVSKYFDLVWKIIQGIHAIYKPLYRKNESNNDVINMMETLCSTIHIIGKHPLCPDHLRWDMIDELMDSDLLENPVVASSLGVKLLLLCKRFEGFSLPDLKSEEIKFKAQLLSNSSWTNSPLTPLRKRRIFYELIETLINKKKETCFFLCFEIGLQNAYKFETLSKNISICTNCQTSETLYQPPPELFIEDGYEFVYKCLERYAELMPRKLIKTNNHSYSYLPEEILGFYEALLDQIHNAFIDTVSRQTQPTKDLCVKMLHLILNRLLEFATSVNLNIEQKTQGIKILISKLTEINDHYEIFSTEKNFSVLFYYVKHFMELIAEKKIIISENFNPNLFDLLNFHHNMKLSKECSLERLKMLTIWLTDCIKNKAFFENEAMWEFVYADIAMGTKFIDEKQKKEPIYQEIIDLLKHTVGLRAIDCIKIIQVSSKTNLE